MDPITVNLNIIYDQNSNYTDAEKQKIRETYIARTQAAFGKIEVKFNITEMAGTASNLANGNRSIATGSINGAINAFFTKSEALPSSEVTNTKAGSIFISTGSIADSDDLTHGIVHAAGIASGQNGYPSLPNSPLPGIWGEATRRGVDFYKERSAEAVTQSIVKYLNGNPQIHHAVFPMSTARHKQQDLQVLKTGLNSKFPHYGP